MSKSLLVHILKAEELGSLPLTKIARNAESIK